MKKIKISDSELRLLLFLLALVLLAASYFLVFQKCVTTAEEVEALNEENRKIVTNLESMVNRQAEVEAETAAYNELVEDIIAKYPPSLTTEKAIVIIQDVEDISGMHVSNISFLMNNLLGDISSYGTASADTADASAAATASSIGYYASLSMNYEADYDSLKEMITYISESEDRMTIPAITAAYDNETGNITGVITVNMYYLTNTGKEYEAPKLTGIGSGVEDIFRSGGVGIRNSVDGEDGQEEEEAEE